MAINRTFTASSSIVTAADMNGIQASWDVYTPIWTGSTTNPVIGNGTISGAWIRFGKTVNWRFLIVCGSTTTYGSGTYLLTLPTSCAASYVANQNLSGSSGSAFLGATSFPIAVNRYTASTTVYFSAPSGGVVTPTVPVTFANGAVLAGGGTYEAT